MAWEGKESNNICIDRNCHQKILSKKSLPDAQELFWLGGGIQCLPPSDKGLIVNFCFVVNSAVQTDISDIVLGKGQSHNYDKYKMKK